MLTIKKVNSQKYIISAERGKVSERNEALKRLVWKHSHHVPGYQFTPKYLNNQWNGKVNVFTPANIPAGFLQESIEELDKNQIPWQWEEEPQDLPFYTGESSDFTYDEFYKFCCNIIKACDKKFEKKHNIKLEIRDYQIKTGYKFLTHRNGIALHATSAGKSLTIAFVLGFLFYKNLIKKAVILVPLQSLVTQFYEDLKDFGFKESFLGKVYSDAKEINKPLVIAMNNSSYNLIDTLDGKTFFEETDVVICDEVHRASAKTVSTTIRSFINSKYFLGCTGTLPNDELNKDKIYSLFGYVLDQRKLKELEEEYKAVASVKVGILEFCYKEKAFKSRIKRSSSTKDWNEEVSFLQHEDEFRNPYIVQTVINNWKQKRNIIVLVKNIEYGVRMFRWIKEKAKSENVRCIFGSGEERKKLEEKDEIIQQCKQSTDPYILVTNFQIFHLGMNLPNLNLAVMIDAGESNITVAQTIGRVVRKTKTINEVFVLDCSCDLKYGHRHCLSRIKLYQAEGFTVLKKKIYQKVKELDYKNSLLNK